MRKIFTLLFLPVAVFISGCGHRSTMAPTELNVLGGLIRYNDESYAPTGPNRFTIHTDELLTRKNYSGEKMELLWGLITLKDY